MELLQWCIQLHFWWCICLCGMLLSNLHHQVTYQDEHEHHVWGIDCILEESLGKLHCVWQFNIDVTHSDYFEGLAIYSCDAAITDTVSLFTSATVTVSDFFSSFLEFWPLGPCPYLPLPFDQQFGLLWSVLLQFSHITSDPDFSLPFPWHCFLPLGFFPSAASADLVVLVLLSLNMWCCASSMMKAMRSLGFILFDDDIPRMVLAHSVAIMVCKVGR